MLIFVKNDDCVSYKMTFHHVFIYLDLVCILYPVCSLQSAVCSLHFVLTGIVSNYCLRCKYNLIYLYIFKDNMNGYLNTFKYTAKLVQTFTLKPVGYKSDIFSFEIIN